MNANTVTTRTESPARGLKPGNVGRSTRAVQSNALADLKNRLLREALNRTTDEPLSKLVRLAAVEAEAQAWLTSFPLLLFPTLLEEKISEAKSYIVRQQRVWPGS
jgi:hypothetical protein